MSQSKEDFCRHLNAVIDRMNGDPHLQIHIRAALASYEFDISPKQAINELLAAHRAKIDAENDRKRAAGEYPYDGTY